MPKEKLKEKNHTSHVAPYTSNKGITLIALIITIVVMLILVAVTLSIALGENGVVNTAKEAAEKTDIEKDKEELELLVSEWEMEKVKGSTKDLKTFLAEKYGEENVVEDENGVITVITAKGNELVLDSKDGNNNTETTSALTLNSNGDEIFIGWPETGFPSNGSKLVYKAEGKTIEIVTRYETPIEPHMILVNYSDGEGVTSSFVRASNFTMGNHTFGVNCSMPHYPTDWTDYRVNGVCRRVQQSMGIQQVIEHNIYGVLPESEYPQFYGDWEIDTENSNANGIQYLSNVLIPTTN